MTRGVQTGFGVKYPGPSDSGWITFPYNANWSNVAGWQTAAYRKISDKVELIGLAGRASSTSGANAVIGQLPTGFRPLTGLALLQSALQEAAGVYAADQVYVDTSGNVTTTSSIAVGAGVYLYGYFFIH